MEVNLKHKDLSELRDNFLNSWSKLVNDICEDPVLKDCFESAAWLREILNYNVRNGKMTRGLTVVKAFYEFTSSNNGIKNEELVIVLGWCVEMLQACCLIADDIMDKSEMRRGKPCWYKVKGVGMLAVNDSFMLEQAMYFLLKKYFGRLDIYTELVDIFHEIGFKTTLGQCMDTKTSGNDINEFTAEKYGTIAKYKTSIYSFLFPFKLALLLARKPKPSANMEQALLTLGHLFQVQDDFIDCFGLPEVTGKVGTDIVEGKCTWLIVKALERANNEQRTLLETFYGKVTIDEQHFIINLYKALGLEKEFIKFETETYEKLCKDFNQFSAEQGISAQPFLDILRHIYQRQK